MSSLKQEDSLNFDFNGFQVIVEVTRDYLQPLFVDIIVTNNNVVWHTSFVENKLARILPGLDAKYLIKYFHDVRDGKNGCSLVLQKDCIPKTLLLTIVEIRNINRPTIEISFYLKERKNDKHLFQIYVAMKKELIQCNRALIFGDFDNEEFPSPVAQREQFTTLAVAIENEMKEGDNWYLINRQWWNHWKSYTNVCILLLCVIIYYLFFFLTLHYFQYEEGACIPFVFHHKPPKIDNSILLTNDGSLKRFYYPHNSLKFKMFSLTLAKNKFITVT